MKSHPHVDAEALIREVEQYLAAIDVFRTERCDPTWRRELVPSDELWNARPASRRSGSRSSETRRS